MSRAVLPFLAAIFSVLLYSSHIATAEDPQNGVDSQRSGVVEMGRPTHPAVVEAAPQTVGPNVNATMDPAAQNETSIAADPANSLNLVAGANDYRYGDSGGGVAWSFDGGDTWSSDTLWGLNPALGKYDAQGDPAIVPYRDGFFFYAFIDFSRTTAENRLAVASSTDGGATWPQIGVIIDHEGAGSHDFEDKEFIAVDNTGGPFDANVYVTWTRFPIVGSTFIMFSRSTDLGANFSTPQQISDSTFGYQGSVPVVGPNGEIYVSWLRSTSIQFDRSTDGGLTWGSDVTVDSVALIPSPLPGAAFRVNSFPTIAVDRSGGPYHGAIYVAWADNVGLGQGPDILLSRSIDNGATWSSPARVSDDTNSAYQFFPWVTVDGYGNVNVIFFDRRDSPGTDNYHTYSARSTNGGLAFEPNVRVSDEISDASNDGFGGAFIGDYNGMTSSAEASHPYWTDTRGSNGNAEGYTSRLTDVRLQVPGTCPGTIEVGITDATPGGQFVVVRSGSLGASTVPGGACADLPLALVGPKRLKTATADANGEFFVTLNPHAGACGQYLQAVDLESCTASNVAQVPELSGGTAGAAAAEVRASTPSAQAGDRHDPVGANSATPPAGTGPIV